MLSSWLSVRRPHDLILGLIPSVQIRLRCTWNLWRLKRMHQMKSKNLRVNRRPNDTITRAALSATPPPQNARGPTIPISLNFVDYRNHLAFYPEEALSRTHISTFMFITRTMAIPRDNATSRNREIRSFSSWVYL